MGLDRMMCQMQKNAQSFGTIFGVSEWSKDLERETERQRERVNEERPQKRVSITSAVYTNVFPHK